MTSINKPCHYPCICCCDAAFRYIARTPGTAHDCQKVLYAEKVCVKLTGPPADLYGGSSQCDECWAEFFPDGFWLREVPIETYLYTNPATSIECGASYSVTYEKTGDCSTDGMISDTIHIDVVVYYRVDERDWGLYVGTQSFGTANWELPEVDGSRRRPGRPAWGETFSLEYTGGLAAYCDLSDMACEVTLGECPS